MSSIYSNIYMNLADLLGVPESENDAIALSIVK